ncbi:MAG: hypothetical protein AAF851_05665 [Myxococcota bacterium]
MTTNGAVIYPARFDAASYVLRATLGGFTASCTFTAQPGRDYWPVGDSRTDGASGDGDLLTQLQSCLATHPDALTFIPSVSLTFVGGEPRIQASISAGFITLLWEDPATTLDPAVFGFEGSTTPPAGIVTAPSRLPGWWLPGAPLSEDSELQDEANIGQSRALTGRLVTTDFGSTAARRAFGWELLDRSLVKRAASETPANTFEHAWVESIRPGRRFRLYEDLARVAAGQGFQTLTTDSLDDPMSRDGQHSYRWAVNLQTRVAGLATDIDGVVIV